VGLHHLFVKQVQVLHGTDKHSILQPYPKVRAWMQAVAGATAPHYKDVHVICHKVAKLRSSSTPVTKL